MYTNSNSGIYRVSTTMKVRPGDPLEWALNGLKTGLNCNQLQTDCIWNAIGSNPIPTGKEVTL